MKSTPVRVVHVAAEAYPLLKTGGLADVMGALPAALVREGAEARVMLPGFEPVLDALESPRDVATLPSPWDASPVRLVAGRVASLGGLTCYAVRADTLYLRTGGPYADPNQKPWPDNHRRFALLSYAAARLAAGADTAWQPQVVHGHDWHAGLMPAYLHHDPSAATRVRSVFTVHNLAYQGLFAADTFDDLGLPAHAWSMQGLEFHGQVSFMKAGLQHADAVTTVSPRYAREILTEAQGAGLHGVLASRANGVQGILNGVDSAVWNPAADAHLAAPYSATKPNGKKACKAALQAAMGLDANPDALLFGVVSRLTEQKGLHLVQQMLPELLALGGQLVVLGSGDSTLEAAFANAAQLHPTQVAFRLGFDEPLAHRIYAGIDVVMVPSRFEPCGLTQLYGLAYGALPLVHRVGGLADTVVDVSLEHVDANVATGFVFDPFTLEEAQRALRRAFALHRRPSMWRNVRACAMRQHFGWDTAALAYMALYRQLLALR